MTTFCPQCIEKNKVFKSGFLVLGTDGISNDSRINGLKLFQGKGHQNEPQGFIRSWEMSRWSRIRAITVSTRASSDAGFV